MPCEARWLQGQSHNTILNLQFHYYQYKLITIMFQQCVSLGLSYYQYCNFQLCVTPLWWVVLWNINGIDTVSHTAFYHIFPDFLMLYPSSRELRRSLGIQIHICCWSISECNLMGVIIYIPINIKGLKQV